MEQTFLVVFEFHVNFNKYIPYTKFSEQLPFYVDFYPMYAAALISEIRLKKAQRLVLYVYFIVFVCVKFTLHHIQFCVIICKNYLLIT